MCTHYQYAHWGRLRPCRRHTFAHHFTGSPCRLTTRRERFLHKVSQHMCISLNIILSNFPALNIIGLVPLPLLLWQKNPWQKQLKERRGLFWLSALVGTVRAMRTRSSQPQEEESNEGLCLAHYLFFIHSWSYPQGTVPPTMGHSSIFINPVKVLPSRLSQRLVLQALLGIIRLTTGTIVISKMLREKGKERLNVEFNIQVDFLFSFSYNFSRPGT